MSGALRVLVVDDQQLLRRGLVMLFGTVEGVDVVAQAAHGAEALAVLRAEDVDVVLADAKMPVMDGIELVRRCAREHPGLPVLVLTTFDEPDVVRGAGGGRGGRGGGAPPPPPQQNLRGGGRGVGDVKK